MAAKNAAKPKTTEQAKYKKKKYQPQKVTDEQLADAITSTGGNYVSIGLYLANKYGTTLSCSRISERISASEELQTVLSEATLQKLKLVEGQLDKKIREGNLTAIIFYLKTKGKDYGWSERHEITGENGDPLLVPEIHVNFKHNEQT